MQPVELKLVDSDGVERTETIRATLIVECNSGPHAGTQIYRDDKKRYVGYDVNTRRRWVFDHVPDDDEIDSYCDNDQEFLAAMLKLGRSTAY
jgi:hypothetical protein